MTRTCSRSNLWATASIFIEFEVKFSCTYSSVKPVCFRLTRILALIFIYFTNFLLTNKASDFLLHEPYYSELLKQGLRDASVS